MSAVIEDVIDSDRQECPPSASVLDRFLETPVRIKEGPRSEPYEPQTITKDGLASKLTRGS